MNIKIIGSTKVGYKMLKEEAIDFAGKSAGICYMPDTIDVLFSESEEKTLKRAKRTLESGHHSVYDHPTYNLVLEGIPKILAMILNNESMYTTSEKSARYTKMEVSEREKVLYEKWIEIYKEKILGVYPNLDEKHAQKLAQENARLLISIFTPSTTMEYTTSLRQLNYIIHFFENYIANEPENNFNKLLKPYLKQFIEELEEVKVEGLNSDAKQRKLSLFDDRNERKEEFGENYCINYYGTFAELAQAQRHRTLEYKIQLLDEEKYFVPEIIKGTELEKEWLKDIAQLSDLFPQGLLIKINERGTVENFILKCQERLCGCAQLEIAMQTKEILDKYIEKTKETNKDVNEYLLKYSKGARCTFPGFKCTSPCVWGAKGALTRKI